MSLGLNKFRNCGGAVGPGDVGYVPAEVAVGNDIIVFEHAKERILFELNDCDGVIISTPTIHCDSIIEKLLTIKLVMMVLQKKAWFGMNDANYAWQRNLQERHAKFGDIVPYSGPGGTLDPFFVGTSFETLVRPGDVLRGARCIDSNPAVPHQKVYIFLKRNRTPRVMIGSYNSSPNSDKCIERCEIVEDETKAMWHIRESINLFLIAQPIVPTEYEDTPMVKRALIGKIGDKKLRHMAHRASEKFTSVHLVHMQTLKMHPVQNAAGDGTSFYSVFCSRADGCTRDKTCYFCRSMNKIFLNERVIDAQLLECNRRLSLSPEDDVEDGPVYVAFRENEEALVRFKNLRGRLLEATLKRVMPRINEINDEPANDDAGSAIIDLCDDVERRNGVKRRRI